MTGLLGSYGDLLAGGGVPADKTTPLERLAEDRFSAAGTLARELIELRKRVERLEHNSPIVIAF